MFLYLWSLSQRAAANFVGTRSLKVVGVFVSTADRAALNLTIGNSYIIWPNIRQKTTYLIEINEGQDVNQKLTNL